MNGLLDGLRIVEGSAFIAAPLGGMTLAALGADVIRFDNLTGGLDADRWPVTDNGFSLYWAGLNKGKRSFAVDLRSEEGRELVTALIAAPGPEAGIFSTNLPAKGWLSYEALAAQREDLVMLSISGARDGSAQVDYTVNAVSGFPMITGPAGYSGPIDQVLPAWDIATGYAAAMALLAAERHRTRTGPVANSSNWRCRISRSQLCRASGCWPRPRSTVLTDRDLAMKCSARSRGTLQRRMAGM